MTVEKHMQLRDTDAKRKLRKHTVIKLRELVEDDRATQRSDALRVAAASG